MYHELLALCINKGKLFRVTTVTSNKKWNKRALPGCQVIEPREEHVCISPAPDC